jgi:hypothetical protein
MRALRLFVPVAILAAAALAGCSAHKTLSPDLPPETIVFVQGQLDTVNHVVELRWFGSDPDGQVVGYEFRFHGLPAPADSDWHFTARHDSVFTIPSPFGFSATFFEVRAIDNEGLRDPTPARQYFSFSNQPPKVRFIDAPAPSDTTFPAATVSWLVTDPDGDPTKAKFLIWLDGGLDTLLVVGARTATIPPDAFLQGGVFHSGPRQAFLQAIDDGGMRGNVVSTSWMVRAPQEGATHARFLLLDDVSTNDAVDVGLDSLYRNAAARNLPAGSWQVLNLKTTKAFRSPLDLQYALTMFDAAAWTRGTTSPNRNPDFLRLYQSGVAAYVAGGGHMLIEGSYLVLNVSSLGTTTGALPDSFFRKTVGVSPVSHQVSGRPGEFTYEWGLVSGRPVRSTLYNLQIATKPSAGVSAYSVPDTNDVAMWAFPNSLTPAPAGDQPFGFSRATAGGRGRLVVIGASLYALDRPGVRSAPALLDGIFQQFGITSP